MGIVWTKTMDDCDSESWESIFGSNILKSYNLLLSVDKSNLVDVELRYLHLKDNNKLVAIIPCFIFILKLEILTIKPIKQVINTVRKIFPNFLKVKIFFVGTPIAICDHVIGIKSKAVTEYKEIFRMLFGKIKKYAKKIKSPLIIIKEIPSHDTVLLQCVKDSNIIVGKSLPNSFIFLDKRLGGWTDAFRARYRRRIKRQSQ